MNSKFYRLLVMLLVFGSSLALPVAAQMIMPETSVLLPLTEKTGVRWVIPPAGQAFIDSVKGQRHCFSIDPDGHAWLGFENGLVVCPEKGFKFKLGEAFWNFVHLDNGVMVFATASRFGMIQVSDQPSGKETELPVIQLQTVAMLPPDCTKMVKGADNSLYFICNNEAKRENIVYLFKPQAKAGTGSLASYQKIFSSEIPVNAVAGDGSTTYVASSRMILCVDNRGQMKPFYVHPTQAVAELAYSQNCGLFYATGFAAGYLGANGPVEILNTKAPEIAISGSSLHVLFPQSYGVMAINGADQLKLFDRRIQGIKKIRMTDAGDPLFLSE